MDSFKDLVAFWATVLGTVIGFFGVIQSRDWLAVAGVVIVAGSIGTMVYARKQRELIRSAASRVGNRSIDSLNLASLRRRLNRSLVIQEAKNFAVIDGEDLAVTWKCSGYCEAARETLIEFSIDADTNIPFDALDCFAFDVRRDPRRRHPIRPILVGPDGISKKIAVPLLAPLSAMEPFCVVLKYRLPNCLKAGVDYYTATLSFEQARIQRYLAQLQFRHGRPEWVRVYERRASGETKLLKDLRPQNSEPDVREYEDKAVDVPARIAMIYVFSRPTINSESGLGHSEAPVDLVDV